MKITFDNLNKKIIFDAGIILLFVAIFCLFSFGISTTRVNPRHVIIVSDDMEAPVSVYLRAGYVMDRDSAGNAVLIKY